MGDDNKKSFWTSLPGILTGVAAVIVAVGGILAAYNNIAPSQNSSPNPQPTTLPTPTIPPSSLQQPVCGTQLEGVPIFGPWRWTGSTGGNPQSGLFTFNENCTFTNTATSGYKINDEGTFLVSSSPDSIILTNKASGKETKLLVSGISENSFHASTPDNYVNLDFIKPS